MTKSYFLDFKSIKNKFKNVGKGCLISNKASFIGEKKGKVIEFCSFSRFVFQKKIKF